MPINEFGELGSELLRLLDWEEDAAFGRALAKAEELTARYEAGEYTRRGYARELLRIAEESLAESDPPAGDDPGDGREYMNN